MIIEEYIGKVIIINFWKINIDNVENMWERIDIFREEILRCNSILN